MSALPRWLTVLQDASEAQRDAALNSLAQSLKSAAAVHEAATRTTTAIAQAREMQQSISSQRSIDLRRLRELRQQRQGLQAESETLRAIDAEIHARVQQLQKLVASKESDVEVLRRLRQRLLNQQRQNERRRDEKAVLESVLSLCNTRAAD